MIFAADLEKVARFYTDVLQLHQREVFDDYIELADDEAVEIAAAWQVVPTEQAPQDTTPLGERLDGVPIHAIDGHAASGDALSFELPTTALEHDGVRIVAAVGAGGLEATLYGGPEVLQSLKLLPRPGVADSPAPLLWGSHTLSFDSELRESAEGQSLRLVVSPIDDRGPHRAFVVMPSLVQKRTGITLSSASFDLSLIHI